MPEILTFALLFSPSPFSFNVAPGYTAIPTSSGLTPLLTWMPPMGVLMSTCLSCPSFSFFTFTLHAGSSRAATDTSRIPVRQNLVCRMCCSFPGNLGWAFQACAALGDVWNRDRKMAANWNLSKERLHRSYLGDRRVGKCAQVILNFREVACEVRVSHRHDRSFLRGMI